MEIISFTLKQSGWLESKPNSEKYSWRFENHNLQSEIEIFSFTFHFLVLFLCTDHYTHTSRNSDGHR